LTVGGARAIQSQAALRSQWSRVQMFVLPV
jgi:hypothetical protein